jgi:hypothetical protein
MGGNDVPVPRTHTLTIPKYRPPLTNELMFGPVGRRIRLQRECSQLFAYYAMLQLVPPATGKRRVSLVVTLSGRMRESDADSLWKATLDALVNCGLLLNDTVRGVELGSVTFERGEERCTKVILEHHNDTSRATEPEEVTQEAEAQSARTPASPAGLADEAARAPRAAEPGPARRCCCGRPGNNELLAD